MKASSYKELAVWLKAIELVKYIYALTNSFPPAERYGLASQMQRAAVSIPSNIAEGYMRQSNREYRQFLSIALGSAAEIETLLIICRSLSFTNASLIVPCDTLNVEVLRMLRSMIKNLPKVNTQANEL